MDNTSKLLFESKTVYRSFSLNPIFIGVFILLILSDQTLNQTGFIIAVSIWIYQIWMSLLEDKIYEMNLFDDYFTLKSFNSYTRKINFFPRNYVVRYSEIDSLKENSKYSFTILLKTGKSISLSDKEVQDTEKVKKIISAKIQGNNHLLEFAI
jgi:hypothetical protein